MIKMTRNIAMSLILSCMIFALFGCGENMVNILSNENQMAEESNFSLGKWDENVYKNEFLGLSLKIPDGWQRYTKDQLAQLMNVGIELMNDDQKAAAKLAKQTAVYYAGVRNPNTGESILIMSEKPMLPCTLDFYISSLKTQLENLESISYDVDEVSTETLAGREVATLSSAASTSGTVVSQEYYTYKLDDYFVNIIKTSTSSEFDINDYVSSL